MDNEQNNSHTESSLVEQSPTKCDDVNVEEKLETSENNSILRIEQNEELLNYLKMLSNVASQKSSDIILNKGLPYAVCIMKVIITSSKSNIRILSLDKNLEYLRYDVIIDSITSALQKNVNVKILTNNDVSILSKECYASIIKIIPDNIFNDYLKLSPIVSSFITGDNDMFLFEYNEDDANGLASFNDKEMTDKFNTIFDNLFKQC